LRAPMFDRSLLPYILTSVIEQYSKKFLTRIIQNEDGAEAPALSQSERGGKKQKRFAPFPY